MTAAQTPVPKYRLPDCYGNILPHDPAARFERVYGGLSDHPLFSAPPDRMVTAEDAAFGWRLGGPSKITELIKAGLIPGCPTGRGQGKTWWVNPKACFLHACRLRFVARRRDRAMGGYDRAGIRIIVPVMLWQRTDSREVVYPDPGELLTLKQAGEELGIPTRRPRALLWRMARISQASGWGTPYVYRVLRSDLENFRPLLLEPHAR